MCYSQKNDSYSPLIVTDTQQSALSSAHYALVRDSSIHVKCEGFDWVRMTKSDDAGFRPYFPLLSLSVTFSLTGQAILPLFSVEFLGMKSLNHGFAVFFFFSSVFHSLFFVFAKCQGKRKKKKEQHLERKRHSSKEEGAQCQPISTKQEVVPPKAQQNGGPPPGYR